MFKTGDRVRLVKMGPDPDPIPVGSTGTVTHWAVFGDRESRQSVQYGVQWDNGRSLLVVCPPDVLAREA